MVIIPRNRVVRASIEAPKRGGTRHATKLRRFKGTVVSTYMEELEVEVDVSGYDNEFDLEEAIKDAFAEKATIRDANNGWDVEDIEEVKEPTDEDRLREEFGPRCDEFEEGCVVCEAYKKFDSGTPVDELIDTSVSPEVLQRTMQEVLQRNGVK